MVLDLLTKQIAWGGKLRTAKKLFGAVTIKHGGKERTFSFGGFAEFYFFFGWYSVYHKEVDEWVEETSSWRPVTSLLQKRTFFGAVSVPKQLVCPGHQKSTQRHIVCSVWKVFFQSNSCLGNGGHIRVDLIYMQFYFYS